MLEAFLKLMERFVAAHERLAEAQEKLANQPHPAKFHVGDMTAPVNTAEVVEAIKEVIDEAFEAEIPVEGETIIDTGPQEAPEAEKPAKPSKPKGKAKKAAAKPVEAAEPEEEDDKPEEEFSGLRKKLEQLAADMYAADDDDITEAADAVLESFGVTSVNKLQDNDIPAAHREFIATAMRFFEAADVEDYK